METEQPVVASRSVTPISDSDVRCETCHTTQGATFYDQRVSPLRLCLGCFKRSGGVDPRPQSLTSPTVLSTGPMCSKTPLSSPINSAEISSQPDGRVIEPSEPRDDTSDGRSRRRKYASRAEQQKAYRARKAAPQQPSA